MHQKSTRNKAREYSQEQQIQDRKIPPIGGIFLNV
ncbi:hypothetical protein P781_07930 [Vibrio mimicus CAIM 1883]|nr:hypothetical protein P781_07930 [Vibrio mimicus CAIM 1883]